MKKISIALTSLAVAATLVSCKKQGDMNGSKAEVSFAITPEMAATRGLPVETAADIVDMGVFGYYTGDGGTNNWSAKGSSATPNFMDHVKLSNNSGAWTYTHKVYWPQASDANVTFFAYSPYATLNNGITVMSTTGIPTISYTVPTSCANQPDLMVSALKTDLNKSTNANIPVNFPMRHALTCIGFKVTGNGEKITKIKVSGVVTTGTMTVAENGTPSWNLTGSPTGDFEATVDTVTLSGSLQQANDSVGYLMMIPQTLPTGAKLLISLDNGRDFDFDISGKVWAAGQRINYCIGITPDAVLSITPNNLSMPNAGGYASFNVVEENDAAGISWTVNSSQSWILVCDNLADLQAWSAGTKTAAQVRNLDGNAPGQSYSYTTPNPSVSGSGTKTLYALVNTDNTSTTANRTGTISLASDTTKKTTISQLLKLDPAAVATGSKLANAYVGAFWRADQTGERIIRIPVSGAANAGAWSASILSADGNWPADLALFSTTASTDGGITWDATSENPADMIISDAAYQVTDGQSSVSGTVTSGGNIYFRIGLKSTYTPTEAAPARYAVVLLAYGNPVKYHAIFLRQGHDPDYVMRPNGDPVNSGGMNNVKRPDAKRFSPYNLTSPGYNPAPAGTLVPVGGGDFTRYPSQAGAYFQFAGTTGKVRLAYHPVNPERAPSGWSTTVASGYWATLGATHETCPAGYVLSTGTTVNFRRPYDGSISADNTAGLVSGSEMRTSLWLNPQVATSWNNTTNSVWGYYADGFFDRRVRSTLYYGYGSALNASVSGYTPVTDVRNADVAYQGRLFFNPKTLASLFIPSAGNRNQNGELNSAGDMGYYGTASIYSVTYNGLWNLIVTSGSASVSSNTRPNGVSIRCIRP